MSVYSANGTEVIRRYAEGESGYTSMEVDIRDFPCGIYFIRCNSGDKTFKGSFRKF
jgi:hypothetical protein